MTSEVKFDLIFEISNLDYPGIHVHVASNSHIVDLRGHDSLQTASEVTNGLGIELSGLNNLLGINSKSVNYVKCSRNQTNWYKILNFGQDVA